MLKTAPCKGCGKKILWAETENGTRIPLDTVAPVYEATFNGEGEPYFAKRMKDCYVTHFATCPQAAMFSSSTKKETPAP